jgi:hypothetical protein
LQQLAVLQHEEPETQQLFAGEQQELVLGPAATAPTTTVAAKAARIVLNILNLLFAKVR